MYFSTKHSKIVFLVLITLILIPILSHTSLAWWNDTWTYRKPIVIKEVSGQNLTKYFIHLNITYDSDMKSDFSDLRFTWLNVSATPRTEEVIKYNLGKYDHLWYEPDKKLYLDTVDGKYTDVIVEIPYIRANNDNYIYMYYGNKDAQQPDYADDRPSGIIYKTFDTGTLEGLHNEAECEASIIELVNHTIFGTKDKWDYAVKIGGGSHGTCGDGMVNVGFPRTYILNNVGFLMGYDWATPNQGYCEQAHYFAISGYTSGIPCYTMGHYFGYDSKNYQTYLVRAKTRYSVSDIQYPRNKWYTSIGSWYNYSNIRVVNIMESNNTIMKDHNFNVGYTHHDMDLYHHEAFAVMSGGSDYFDNFLITPYTYPEPQITVYSEQAIAYTKPLNINWVGSLKYYLDPVVSYFLVTVITIILAFTVSYISKSGLAGWLVGLISIVLFTSVELYPIWAGILLSIILGVILMWGEKK